MSDVATDAAFRETLSRAPAEPLPGEDRLIICKQGPGGTGKLYSVSLSSLHYSGRSTKSVEATSVKNLLPVPEMPVASCHGVILLSHYHSQRTWTVCNPFTNEAFELPPYGYLTRGRSSSGGIGYDAGSGEFKVVRISGIEGVDALETLIYSVKSDTWRRIEDYPNCIFKNCKLEHGVFFNGGLYWFVTIKMEGGNGERIIAFDLGTENYSLIPLPPAFSGVHLLEDKYLDESDGCLFASYSYEEKFIIWMLKDQGGKNMWNKFVSLDQLCDVGVILMNPRLISYCKSKNLVVVQNEDDLLWYDVEKECVTNVSITGVEGCFSCQAFPTSWLDGSLKRKRTISKDSLDLKLTAFTFQIPSSAGD